MSKALRPVRPLSDFLRVLIAPAIWFAHLVVIYGAEALICTGSTISSGRAMVWTVAVATAAALIGLIGSAAGLGRPLFHLAGRTDRSGSGFLPVAAKTLSLLSMLGVIWTALPTTLLSVCASPAG